MEAEETQRAIAYVQDMANKTKFERLKRLMVADLELEDTVRRRWCDCCAPRQYPNCRAWGVGR